MGVRDTSRMDRSDRFDPYRVLGVPPGAPMEEVKAAYRRLAKRHHPDAAGPDQVARFLRVQAAYETIARSRGAATRAEGGAAHAPSPAARGAQRDAGRDWYAAAREAARARSRAGRGRGTGPRGRGAGRSGRPPEEGRGDEAWRRRATLGSTTYDDAVEDAPAWDGSAWYGAASGTYWTVNPREYADPRKHGPGYLGRSSEWTGDRPAASFTDARHSGPAGPWPAGPSGGPTREAGAAEGGTSRPAPEPGDRRPASADTSPADASPTGAASTAPPTPVASRRRAASIAAAIRAAVGGKGRPRGTLG
jgi:curved DNA-binding protein CbpA